jgi:hypothetical protein
LSRASAQGHPLTESPLHAEAAAELSLAVVLFIGWGLSKLGSSTPATAPSTSSSTAPSGDSTPTPKVQLLQVTAREYQADFDANEVAADDKYKDKKLLMSGKVKSIEKDFSGEAYLTLVAGGEGLASFTGVQAHLKDEAVQQASRLGKGQSVTLVCDPATRVMAIAGVKNCSFYKGK